MLSNRIPNRVGNRDARAFSQTRDLNAGSAQLLLEEASGDYRRRPPPLIRVSLLKSGVFSMEFNRHENGAR